jgi:hypothetical protein
MGNSSENYVYLKPACGFGSFISQLDRAFMYCKTHSRTKLLVDFRSSPYANDPNINAFELYFEPVNSRKPTVITDTDTIDEILSDRADLKENEIPWSSDPKGLARAEYQISQGKSISQKLVPTEIVRQNIKRYKDPFFSPDKYIVGVHARFGNREEGWSKDPQRLNKKNKNLVFNKLSEYLSNIRKLQRRVGVFVCSDTPSFIEEMKDRYDSTISTNRFFLSEGAGASPHDIYLNKSKKTESVRKIEEYGRTRIGTEALTDIFLLKECDVLFKTPSSFSDLAENSGVPCINIGKA